MALYELGLRTTGVAAASAGLEIRAGAARPVTLLELELVLQAATASTFGLGRPANSGSVAGGTNNPPVDVEGADAFRGSVILAGWTTAPTAPTAFLKRVAFPATIGSRAFWEFRGVVIPAGGSLVLWNLALNGVADVNLVLDDQL